MSIKNTIRATLNFLHLDLTKNLEYDRLTKIIMARAISQQSNCIDVGCHKGEMLDMMLKYAPAGEHIAFEPIPPFYQALKQRYEGKAEVYPYALSDKNGTTTFQFVKNAPAYSGIRKRKYAVEFPDIEEIHVELKTLDSIIPAGSRVDFIKIDVEGAEFGVLKGAKRLLKENKPTVIFESGLGASDFYGTQPGDLYRFITEEAGLHISLLKSFIRKTEPLNQETFENCFHTNKEYYFVAHP